jgi:hypothetical protein
MPTSPGLHTHPSPWTATPPLPDGVGPLPKAFVSAWLTHLQFEWGEITRGYRRQPVANDAPLFEEGQPAHSVYVVESGRIRLLSHSAEGRRRHLMIVGPTGLVGDCGLLQSQNHVVSAEASTDAVVCAVPVAAMLAALTQHLPWRASTRPCAACAFASCCSTWPCRVPIPPSAGSAITCSA